MRARAAGSTVMPSASAMTRNCSMMARVPMVRNSNSWERDRIVSGILCSSVVAIMKTTCGGGSSIDFSRALNEEFESWCTSSMRKIL